MQKNILGAILITILNCSLTFAMQKNNETDREESKKVEKLNIVQSQMLPDGNSLHFFMELAKKMACFAQAHSAATRFLKPTLVNPLKSAYLGASFQGETIILRNLKVLGLIPHKDDCLGVVHAKHFGKEMINLIALKSHKNFPIISTTGKIKAVKFYKLLNDKLMARMLVSEKENETSPHKILKKRGIVWSTDLSQIERDFIIKQYKTPKRSDAYGQFMRGAEKLEMHESLEMKDGASFHFFVEPLTKEVCFAQAAFPPAGFVEPSIFTPLQSAALTTAHEDQQLVLKELKALGFIRFDNNIMGVVHAQTPECAQSPTNKEQIALASLRPDVEVTALKTSGKIKALSYFKLKDGRLMAKLIATNIDKSITKTGVIYKRDLSGIEGKFVIKHYKPSTI